MGEPKHTGGDWDWAVDSYGKVRHSRKYSCVYTTISSPDGDRLVTVAARIENVADAKLIASAKALLAELDVRVGDLVMLRRAIEEGDPKPELLFRVDDMLRETRATVAKAGAA